MGDRALSTLAQVRSLAPWRGTLPSRRSVLVGVSAMGGLVLIYVLVIAIAQSPAHALDQLAADAPLVGLVVVAFGVQVALFAELRAVSRRNRRGAAAGAAGTGASTMAMLACCGHHVADLLPIVGLSAAAVFLEQVKTPLILVGVATNVVGIVLIARELGRARAIARP